MVACCSWGRSVVYAPLGLGFSVKVRVRLRVRSVISVSFRVRVSLLELWSVLRSGEWFGGNIW